MGFLRACIAFGGVSPAQKVVVARGLPLLGLVQVLKGLIILTGIQEKSSVQPTHKPVRSRTAQALVKGLLGRRPGTAGFRMPDRLWGP